MKSKQIIKYILLFLFFSIGFKSVFSQCADLYLYDSENEGIESPEWINCIQDGEPETYNLTFTSPNTISQYRIIFGDGEEQSGNNFSSENVTHEYSTTGIFNVTFIAYNYQGNPDCDIQITGKVYNQISFDPNLVSSGEDEKSCDGTYILNGTNPEDIDPSATGIWESSSLAEMDNSLNYQTNISNLDEGENIFKWTITKGKCSASDEITITNNELNAEINFTEFAHDYGSGAYDYSYEVCESEITLNANLANGAIGSWSKIDGTTLPNIVSENSSTTVISNLQEENFFKWEVTKGTGDLECQDEKTIKIINNHVESTSEIHGSIVVFGEEEVCQSLITVVGNNPADFGDATGFWTAEQGSPTITLPTNPETGVTLPQEEVKLKWTITKDYCSASSELTIINNEVIASIEDNSLDICPDTLVLDANTPVENAIGTWSTTTNPPPTFVDENLNTTTVKNLKTGANSLKWTVTKGSCSAFVNLSVTSRGIFAKATDNIESCIGNSATLNGEMLDNISGETGTWSVLNGESSNIVDENNPTSEVTSLSSGENNLRWTIQKYINVNKTCTEFVDIKVHNNFVYANVGSNSSSCTDSRNIYSTAISIEGASGKWTVKPNFGGGTFSNDTLNNTSIINLDAGENILVWTVSKGGCSAFDELSVTNELLFSANIQTPTYVSGGNLTLIEDNIYESCNELVQLNVTPVGGTSTNWSFTNSPLTLLDNNSINNPKTTKLRENESTFTVTLNDGSGCISTDKIIIRNNSVDATVFDDIVVCDNFTTIEGSAPNSTTNGVGDLADGIWNVQDGGTLTFIEEETNFRTLVGGLQLDDNTFKWTITKGNCTDNELIKVTNNEVFASASDQEVCVNNSTSLDGNNPNSNLGNVANGLWTAQNTSALNTITNENSFNTLLNNLKQGVHKYKWTVSKTTGIKTCYDSKDITITNNTLNISSFENSYTCDDNEVTLTGNGLDGDNSVGFWTQDLTGSITYEDPSNFGAGGVGNIDGSSSLFLWLKADDGTFDSDEELITNNGINVRTWNDFSGNNHNAKQTNNSISPVFKTNALNGKPSLEFPRISNVEGRYLDIEDPDFNNQFTIFAVHKLENSGSEKTIISDWYFGENDRSWALQSNSNKLSFKTSENGIEEKISNFGDSQDTEFEIIRAEKGSNFLKMYLNNTEELSTGNFYNNLHSNQGVLTIGATKNSSGNISGAYGGEIAEIIIYNSILKNAEKIIIENYLSGKYDISLDNNDYYAGDNSEKGDFDFGIIGIGKESDGTHSTSRKDGLEMTISNGFQNNNYLFAGHNNLENNRISTDVSGLDENAKRFNRIWYFDAKGNSNIVNLTFDLSESGQNSPEDIFYDENTHYKLIYRSSNSGNWQVKETSNSVNIDQLNFTNVNMSNDGFYTVAIISPVDFVENSTNITNPNLLLTQVENLENGNNDFIWTVTNGSCIDSENLIAVNNTVYASIESGQVYEVCGDELGTWALEMKGNDPSEFDGFGIWSKEDGSSIEFENITAYNTRIKNLENGENKLTWTVSKGLEPNRCEKIVELTIYNNEVQAEALCVEGDNLCNPNIINLFGENSFEVLGEDIIINWTANDENIFISDIDEYETHANYLINGTNIFQLEIRKGKCSDISENVIVEANVVASNVDDYPSEVCQSSIILTGNDPAEIDANGEWIKFPENTVISTDFQYNFDLDLGENNLVWKVTRNSCSQSTPVTISNNSVDASIEETEVEVCINEAEINAIALEQGTGTWSIEEGDLEVNNIKDKNTDVSDVHANEIKIIDLPFDITKLKWKVEKGICSDEEIVSITNNNIFKSPISLENIVQIEELNDDEVCTDDITLKVINNSTYINSGVSKIWEHTSGLTNDGGIANPISFETQLLNLENGNHNVRWTVTKGESETCSDFIDISFVNNSVSAVTDNDYETCAEEIDNVWDVLNVENPSSSLATGIWTEKDVANTDKIENPDNYNTAKFVNLDLENTFLWTVSKGGCVSYEEVAIVNNFIEAITPTELETCDGTIIMQAESPILNGSIGTWYVQNSAANIPNEEKNNPQITITSLNLNANTFSWVVTKEGSNCSDAKTVTVENNMLTATASDQEVCDDGNNEIFNLDGNQPLNTNGEWKVKNESGLWETNDEITLNSALNTTRIYNLPLDKTYFKWIISKGDCKDSITIKVSNNYVEASAGFDDEDTPGTKKVCSNSVILEAYEPQIDYGPNSIGSWNVSDGSGNFDNGNSPTATVNGLSVTEDNILTWTVNKGICSASDEVIVINNRITPSLAGDDIITCDPFTEMNANNPSLGEGTWLLDTENSGVLNLNDNDASVTYLMEGTYQYFWKVQKDNCSSTTSMRITYNVTPTADFDMFSEGVPFNDGDGSCSPITVSFDNETSYGTGNRSYTWNFGNLSNSTAEEPSSYTFINDGAENITYEVTLTVTTDRDCPNSITKNIVVYPKPHASFTYLNQNEDTDNFCSPVNIEITNTSTGYSECYLSVDDGNFEIISDSLNKIFSNISSNFETHEIKLKSISENGCEDISDITYIQVDPEVDYDFTIDFQDDNANNCSPSIVELESNFGANIYEWDFDGDGEIDETSTYKTSYSFTASENPEEYNIKLTATSIFGCVDENIHTITINPTPTANFDIDGSTNVGCSPFEVSFTNNSLNSSTYSWSFDGDDIPESGDENPTHTFLNITNSETNYSVNMRTINAFGCSDLMTKTVRVKPNITADFMVTDVWENCSPFSVNFLNQTSPIIGPTFEWDFGNGNSGVSETHPENSFSNSSYENNEIYNVKLIATSSFDCVSEVIKQITVYPKVEANYTFGASGDAGCSPFEIQLINTSNGHNSCEWTFGDGSNSSDISENITKIYENPSPSTLQRTLKLFVSNANCSDEIEKAISIYAEVTADFAIKEDGEEKEESCHPFIADMQNNSIGASNYEWIFGDGEDGVVQSNVLNPQNHPYTNTSTINMDSIYTVQLKAISENSCFDIKTLNLLVRPLPQVAFDISTEEACSPLSLQIQNNSSYGDDYHWDYGDGTEDSNNSNNFSKNYINNGSNFENYEIKLDITKNYGDYSCESSTSKELKVYPKITADFSTDDNVIDCSPLNISFDNSSAGNIASYSWQKKLSTENDDSYEEFSTSLHTDIILENSTNLSLIYDIKLVAISPFEESCNSEKSIQITVKPVPTADFFIEDNDGNAMTEGCAPLNIKLINNSTNASLYQWDFENGYNSILNDPTHICNNNGLNAIDYDITLQVTNTTYFCSKTISKTVKIYPEVVASFNTDNIQGCSPLDVGFTNTSTGVELNYDWSLGDGSNNESDQHISHTFENPNNTGNGVIYNVVLTASATVSDYTCSKEFTQEINVKPSPDANFSVNEEIGCSPLSINVQNNSIAENSNYTWKLGIETVGTGSSIASFSMDNLSSVDETRNLELKITNDDNCSDTHIIPITVYPQVNAEFTIIPNILTKCSPFVVDFSNVSVNSQNYSWDFGNEETSNLNNPTTKTYINNTLEQKKYFIKLTANSQYCTNSDSIEITVNPTPVANFTADYDNECAPIDMEFVNNSTGLIDNNYWYFGDSQTSFSSDVTIGHIYENNGNTPTIIDVELKVSNNYSCENTFILNNIQVNPSVTANFNTNIDNGCSPLNVNFNNSSNNSNSYSWNFNNGSSLNTQTDPENINFTSSISDGNEKIYNIELTANSIYGCSNTVTKNVTVYPIPIVDFTQNFTSGCAPFKIEVTNISNGANSFTWDWGDDNDNLETSSVEMIEHNYINNSNLNTEYILELTAQNDINNCSSSLQKSITVYPEINANFEMSDFVGCAPLNITFDNTSIGGVGDIDYIWEMDELATLYEEDGNDIDFTFTNNDVNNQKEYNLKLTATYDGLCSDDTTQTITVFPKPSANFNINVNEGCTPLEVEVTNLSEGQTNNFWTYGDEGNNDNPHFYTNTEDETKEYELILVVQNASFCRDTTSRLITVYPNVTADYSTNTNNGCTPLVLYFQNNSNGDESWAWNFGDGTNSTNESGEHTFFNDGNISQEFDVELISTSEYGCKDTLVKQYTVLPKPDVDFDIDTIKGCTPFTPIIVNTSEFADGYSWNFGDETGANSENTTKTYENNFVDNVLTRELSLTALNFHGCSSTKTATITIYPEVEAIFDITNENADCHPFDISLPNNSNGATIFNWDLGNGSNSNANYPNVRYTNLSHTEDSVYTIKLLASSSYGCKDSTESTITVHPLPKAEFSLVYDENACTPLQVNIENNSEGVDIYHWNFADGSDNFNTNLDNNFSHIYENNSPAPAIYNLSLVVENDFACTQNAEQSIIVNPSITAGMNVITSGCSPLELVFTNQSAGYEPITYLWDFANGSNSSLENPTHTFINNTLSDTIFNVKLVATSGNNCKDSIFQEIEVFFQPTADFTISQYSGCTPFDPTFYQNSIGATNYTWQFTSDPTDITNTTTEDSLKRESPLLNASYNYPASNTVKLTAFSENNCSSVKSEIVTIFPNINVEFSIDELAGCSPFNSSFDNQSDGIDTTYWSFGDGLISLDQNPEHTYLNLSETNQIFNAKLIGTSIYNCKDSMEVEIEVYPSPQADFELEESAGCSPFTAIMNNLTPSPFVGENSYEWKFGNAGEYWEAINDMTVSEDYSINSDIPNTIFVSLKATSPQNCEDIKSIALTVNPKIDVEIGLLNVINVPDTIIGCHPLRLNFESEALGVRDYYWKIGETVFSAEDDPDQLFVNYGEEDTLYMVTLEVESYYDCKGYDTIFVIVHPKPNASFSLNNSEDCAPFEVSISNFSETQGESNYYWNFGDLDVSDFSGANFTHTYNNETEDQIKPVLSLIIRNEYYCYDTTKQIVTVHPEVKSIITVDPDSLIGCHPLTVNFGNDSERADGGFIWNFNDGSDSEQTASPSHLFDFDNTSSVPDTFHVTLIAESILGCENTATVDVIVFPKPEVATSFNVPEGNCSPLNVTIENNSTNWSELEWSYGDGNNQIIDNITSDIFLEHIYSNNTPTTQTLISVITVRNIYGCRDEEQNEITVYPEVNITEFRVDGTSASNVEDCNPFQINFESYAPNVQSYAWHFGDGSDTASLANLPHTFYNDGTEEISYDVELVATSVNQCTDTAKLNVKVFPKPISNFELSNDTVCSPFNVVITDLSSESAIPDGYIWNFDDGASDYTNTVSSHIFQSTSNIEIDRNVSLIVENNFGCTDTTIKTLVVKPNITANFSPSFGTPDTVGCSPLYIDFINQTSSNAEYFWLFGNGAYSDEVHPDNTFENSESNDSIIYTVNLKATSQFGCISEKEMQIVVYPTPTADFNIRDTENFRKNGCSPHTITVDNISSGASNIIWDFGDMSPEVENENTIEHLYQYSNITPNYNFSITVENDFACVNTKSETVSIYPRVVADTEFTNDTIACHPNNVSFQNSSTGAASYEWHLGDGTETIYSVVPASHSYDNTTDAMLFYDTKLIAKSTYFSETTKNCKDSAIIQIAVKPKPIADFQLEIDAGCSPFIAEITNNSQNTISSYWDFGNNRDSTTNELNFNYEYENTQPNESLNNLQLIVENSFECKDTLTKVVIVYPQIIASFSVQNIDTIGCHPFELAFDDNAYSAYGSNNCEWLFGEEDGGTFVTNNPQASVYNTYENTTDEIKTFVTKLYAKKTYGSLECKDSAEIDIYVYPTPTADFEISNNQGCSPLDVLITNTSNGIYDSTYLNFGDLQDTSNVFDNLTHTYINTNFQPTENNYSFSLEVINSFDCKDIKTTNIEVYPNIVANFSVDTVACNPYTAILNNQSQGAATSMWNYGDGATSVIPSSGQTEHPHLYQNEFGDKDTTFNIQLVAVSFFPLCKDTIDMTIRVHPQPTANFQIDTTIGCAPLTITCENLSENHDSSRWEFNVIDFVETTEDTLISYTYNNNSSNISEETIKLTVYNEFECEMEFQNTVFVKPEVNASFSKPLENASCEPYIINFENHSTGVGLIYVWDFGDGEGSNEENPVYPIFNNNNFEDTTYTVKLTAASQHACIDIDSFDIVVYPKPDIDFTTDINSGCSPFNVNITNNTLGADSLDWNFGNTPILSHDMSGNFDYEYSNPYANNSYNYNLTLTAFNEQNCTDEHTEVITLYPKVTAGFIIPDEGCSPVSISQSLGNLTNTSLNSYDLEWYLNDNFQGIELNLFNLTNGSNTEDSILNIKLIAKGEGGCSDTLSKDLIIHPTPSANFTVPDFQGCTPHTAIFENNSEGINLKYLWEFGYGQNSSNSDPNFEKIYENFQSGTVHYYPKLTLTDTINNCSHFMSGHVLIYPKVTADFNAPDAGCSPLEVTFTNSSSGATNFLWDFDDEGITSEQANGVVYTFENQETQNSIFDVQLTASQYWDNLGYACEDSIIKSITVYSTPVINLNINPLEQIFERDSLGNPIPPATISIQDLTIPQYDGFEYFWNFDDSDTIFTEHDINSHQYETWGEYTIRFGVGAEHCRDTFTQVIEILPPIPFANFDTLTSGCAPVTVNIINKSKFVDVNTQYFWSMGDGNFSTTKDLNHTYTTADLYPVELKVVTRSGEHIIRDTVEIYPEAVAYFSLEKELAYVDEEVRFYSKSEEGTRFLWDFGDGETSSEENPTHIFLRQTEETDLPYSIKLEVWTEHDCYDVFEMPDALFIDLFGTVIFPTAFTPEHGLTSASYDNRRFYPEVKGVEEFVFEVFNRWGELLYSSFYKDGMDTEEISWDGFYKDRLLSQGVYVWKVKGIYKDGVKFEKIGDVTLLR